MLRTPVPIFIQKFYVGHMDPCISLKDDSSRLTLPSPARGIKPFGLGLLAPVYRNGLVNPLCEPFNTISCKAIPALHLAPGISGEFLLTELLGSAPVLHLAYRKRGGSLYCPLANRTRRFSQELYPGRLIAVSSPAPLQGGYVWQTPFQVNDLL